jgi:hypothetical protein
MNRQDIEAIAAEVAARLKSAEPGRVDWDRVSIPTFPNPRPQCGKLDPVTQFKLQAIAAKGYECSIAAVIKTAVMCYLRQKWPDHLEDFQALAAQENISVEDLLTRLVTGDDPPPSTKFED